ncbi:MAG: hypothetical protein J5982_01465 [Bacilli bacterium]|nr:hypothetical protein [Bacilli bacterium]
MREEVKTLITEAETSVTEFEKEIFVNDRGFYINAKTMIDDMIEQIMLIKQTVELEDYNEEIYNANKSDLTFIIDTIKQLSDLVKTKTIHIIVSGKGNYRVQVLGEKEMAIDIKENNIEETREIEQVQEEVTEYDNIDENAIDEFLNNNIKTS